MTKVLIVQNYHTPYRHALFDKLVEKGLDLTVVYAHRPEDEGRAWGIAENASYRSVQCRYLRLGKFVWFAFPLRFVSTKKHDFAVLLDNNPTNIAMIFYSLILRMRSSNCLLWVEHITDKYKHPLKTFYQSTSSRLLCRLSSRLIVFSAMTETYLRALAITTPSERMIQAVPFEPEAARAKRSGTVKSFGYLGSNSPRKNVVALLSAFAANTDPDIRLHVAGFNAPEFAGDPRIVWHGYVDQAAREDFFHQVDVLVLPSLADPWGLVINEALHRGCLAAASETCGCSELVKLVSDALVFEPSPQGIAALLHHLRSLSAPECDQLRSRAAAAIDCYSLDRAAEAMLRLFPLSNARECRS